MLAAARLLLSTVDRILSARGSGVDKESHIRTQTGAFTVYYP